MAFFVLAHLDFRGSHVETFQESKEPQGEVIALAFHESHFLVGDPNVAVEVELFTEFLGETFRINGIITVYKSVLSNSSWKLL